MPHLLGRRVRANPVNRVWFNDEVRERMKDVLFEMVRQGAYLKCTAVDPHTGEEAIAIGPANAPEAVRKLAIQKLQARLKDRGQA